MKLKWGDGVIVAGVLAAALLLFVGGFAPASGGVVARITVDGKVVRELPLAGEETRVSLPGAELVVGGGSAWFESAACKDGVCVKTGKLTRAGQTAVCLPGRTMLELVGGEAVDAVIG